MADDTLTPGQEWIKGLQDQGLTDANIGEMKRQRSQDLLGAGYKQEDIDKYFGEQPSQIPNGMQSIAADNLHIAGHDTASMDTADPNSWSDLFKAGFGNSVLSLEYGGAPTKQLPNADQMGFFGHLAAGAGQMLGDFPAGFSSAMGTGLVTKNPFAAGAAYNAVPEALRQMYIKHYQTGAPLDWHDAFTKPVLQAAVVGAVGGKAAEVGGTIAEHLGANALLKTGTSAIAMQSAATGAQSAMQGHLPSTAEFAAGTVFALGFGATGLAKDALYVADNARGRIDLTEAAQAAKKRMEDIYAKTGIHPTEAAKAAAGDPVLKQTVMGANADGDTITDPWLHAAKPEPPKPQVPEEPAAKEAAQQEAEQAKAQRMTDWAKHTAGVDGEEAPKVNQTIAAEAAPPVKQPPEPRQPFGDNYLRDVSKEAPTLHREMSVDALHSLHEGNSPFGWTEHHFADNPDIALGQGDNKGVRIQIGTEGMQGKVNTSKPGMEFGYINRNAEWIIKAHNTDVAKAIQKITVDPDVYNAMQGSAKRRLDNLLRAHEGRGTVVDAPGYPTKPIDVKPAGPNAEATGIPPVENLNAENLNKIAGEPVDPSIVKKYTDKEGKVDTEAVLIDHKAGEEQAKAYRATGRDPTNLPVPVQRFLGQAGDRLIPLESGGGGKPPGPPKPPPEAEGEKPFQKSPEFTMADMNAKTQRATQGSKFADWARAFRAGSWWRELAPATRFDKMFDVVQSEKDMGLEDWLRLAYATSGRVKARIYRGGIKISADEQGLPFYDVNDKVPAMKSIMERAAKLPSLAEGTTGYDRFRAYMQALDTLDRVKLGFKTTYDADTATSHIMAEKSQGGQFKELDALSKDWQKMMDDTMQGLKRSGRLTDEDIRVFKERHPNYFPQRVLQDTANNMRGPNRAGIGNPIKKAEGHDYVLQDPIQTTVEDIFRREKFNDINIARRVAVENLQKHFGGAPSNAKDLVVQAPKPPKPEGSNLPVPLDVAWKNGIIDDEGHQYLDDPNFYQHNPNVIRYWKDGKPMEYTVPDFEYRKEFMDMIMSPKLTEQDFVKGVIASSARGLRATVMSYPATVLRVMFQDSVQAATLSKYGGVPLFNSLHGSMMLLDEIMSKNGMKEQGPLAKEWVRQEMNGNYNMALTDINANHIEELFHSMQKTAHLNGYANGYSKFMDGFQQIMRGMDAMTRAKIASNASKELGVMKGSIYARTVHGDYAESSASQTMNFLTAVTPFFRARMRGFIDGSLRAIKNESTHFAMGAATLGAVSMMFHAYNYWFDKEYGDKIPLNARYSEQPNEVRDGSWMIPLFNGRGEVVRMKLPAGPFEIGYLVNAPINRFMHQFFADDPVSFHGLATDVVKRMAFDSIPGLDNPVAKTIIEGKTGVDTYTMRPMIPARLQHLSADQQVLPWTTTTARALASGINSVTGGQTISPIMVDKTIDNWAGGLGVAVLKSAESATGLGPVPPPHDMANSIWWSSFFARNPGMRAESISRFYTTYSEAEKEHNVPGAEKIHGRRPEGGEPDMPGFREHMGDLREALISSEDGATVSKSMKAVQGAMNPSKGNDAFNNLRRASVALGRINTASYLIQENPKLSEDDKRQLIDKLADQAIRISRIAVTRYKASKEYGDGSSVGTGN